VALEVTDTTHRLLWIVDDRIVATLADVPPRVRASVNVADDGQCTFRYAAADGEWRRIGEPYQATEGHWIGARVGLFCRAAADAYADFTYFRFAPPAAASS
jgi:hypothetical protein